MTVKKKGVHSEFGILGIVKGPDCEGGGKRNLDEACRYCALLVLAQSVLVLRWGNACER